MVLRDRYLIVMFGKHGDSWMAKDFEWMDLQNPDKGFHKIELEMQVLKYFCEPMIFTMNENKQKSL